MSEIALALDREEMALCRTQSVESGNVGISGNYSVQVISKALEYYNLRCLSITSEDGASAM